MGVWLVIEKDKRHCEVPICAYQWKHIPSNYELVIFTKALIIAVWD